MIRNSLDQRAALTGVLPVASTVLCADLLAAEEEQFLRDHIDELTHFEIIRWLHRTDPLADTEPRPIARLAQRILQAAGPDILLLGRFPGPLATIPDAAARDEVVEQVREKLELFGDLDWTIVENLALLADGGAVFREIVRVERAIREQLPPGTRRRWLAALLLPVRRYDPACTERIRDLHRCDALPGLIEVLDKAGLLATVGLRREPSDPAPEPAPPGELGAADERHRAHLAQVAAAMEAARAVRLAHERAEADAPDPMLQVDEALSRATPKDLVALREAVGLAALNHTRLSPPQRERVRHLAEGLCLLDLVFIARVAPSILSEDEVVAIARSGRAGWFGAHKLPAYLVPVMMDAARATPSPTQAEELVDRCAALGLEPRQILAAALDRLRADRVVRGGWLARCLVSNSRWEHEGAEAAYLMLSAADDNVARELSTLCCLGLRAEASAPDQQTAAHAPGVGRAKAIHTALASALIRRAREMLQGGDTEAGARALTALAHLRPASRLHGDVRKLRQLARTPDLEGLVDANAQLLRRESKEPCTANAIVEAIAAFHGREEAW